MGVLEALGEDHGDTGAWCMGVSGGIPGVLGGPWGSWEGAGDAQSHVMVQVGRGCGFWGISEDPGGVAHPM